MPESSDSESDNDNQRSNNNEDNERTRLLPHRAGGNHRNSTYGANRALHAPSTSRSGSSFNRPTTSSSRYQGPIDNTIVQPGPSTSAPTVSAITAAGSRSQQQSKKKHRKNQRQQLVVVADVEPLIAPSQHSINVDDQEAIPETITTTRATTNLATASSSSVNVMVETNERTSGRATNTTRSSRKNRPNVVDHIV